MSPRGIRSDLYSPEDFGHAPPTTRCPGVLAVLSSLLERVVARCERKPALPVSVSSPSSSCSRASRCHGAPSSSSPSPVSAICHSNLAVFSGIRAPAISIEEYLSRIFRYASCSPSCFVVAYTYIDRLIQQQPGLRITSLTVHRVLITSVLVAAKFLDDMYYDNAHYARIGGVSTQEVNRLEKEFLFLMDFRLHVSVSVFESYCSHLEREVAMGGGYQIEKALRTICALEEDARTGQRAPQPAKSLTAVPMRCYQC